MSNALGSTSASVTQLPTASNRASLTLRDVADLHFAAYTGRDASRRLYLQQWCELLGDRRLADLVADALAHFGREPARRYLGRDPSTNQPRWRVLGQRRPSTLNRMRSALSAVLRWVRAARAAAEAGGRRRDPPDASMYGPRRDFR